jgi:hypothetical protein
LLDREVTMTQCWFLPKGGGGSPASASRIIVRRSAAIGDAIAATCVADRLIELGHEIEFQTLPAMHGLLRRHRGLAAVTAPQGFANVNLDQSYERDLYRRTKTFWAMFMESANQQLKSTLKPLNCKPRLVVRNYERDAALAQFEQHPRPWVFICPRSNSYAVRQVQDGTWQEFAALVSGTKFWLGTHGPAPSGIVDLHARDLDNVILWLSVADLLVTVDTGPMHIAAAVNTPIVAINQSSSPHLHLNDQCDFIEVSPDGLDCLNCQLNVCPKGRYLPPCQGIAPGKVAGIVNARLRSVFSEDVSAVVPIYQPDVKVLNHCLENVLPQVTEIVVTAERNSRVPAGALQHPRIRYVQSDQSGIGFGRNVNFGARHAHGRYLLILNDDVFLNANAVEEMKKVMQPGVGMAVHFLRYTSGQIYPTVCGRIAGRNDFYHIDHMKTETSLRQVIEVENACGASLLMPRTAFFEVGGFDEEYFMYSEDNDLSMRVRQAGWKIIYTPHAKGYHLGQQSSSKLGNLPELCRPSIALFHRKWDPYIQANLNRVPGDFSYLEK